MATLLMKQVGTAYGWLGKKKKGLIEVYTSDRDARHYSLFRVAATCVPVHTMALLRAVIGGCSTTGRSILPALASLCAGGGGGQAAVWSQERGFKKSTRRVEVCLLQVRVHICNKYIKRHPSHDVLPRPQIGLNEFRMCAPVDLFTRKRDVISDPDTVRD